MTTPASRPLRRRRNFPRWGNKLITTFRDIGKRTAALVRRFDVISASGPVSGRREALLLILAPILTFSVVLLVTAIAGVAYSPGCNSVGNFVASLVFLPPAQTGCNSVPFMSDVPCLILSFTCPFALVAYRLFRRRLSSLLDAVTTTGLLRPQTAGSGIIRGMEHLTTGVDLTAPKRFGLFLVSACFTIWLYSRNLKGGHLFAVLGNASASGKSNAEALRASWWANYHYHPFLALICVLIGSVGVYYGVRAAWLYVRLGALLFSTRKISPDRLPLEYVPRWRDKSYGWSPVTGMLVLIYFATINFAFSMLAIFDMLRGERWTLVVCGSLAVAGVLSNLAIVLTSLFRMLDAHQAVQDRLRVNLSQIGSSQMSAGQYVVAASDLVTWRRVPVASLSGGVIKILPGVYALLQIFRTLF